MTPRPPAPPQDAPEHERARWWRDHIVKLTREQLSQLIGFSPSRIADVETGRTRSKPYRPIGEETMHAYRMACAAVTLGVAFDWTSCTLRPRGAVSIRVEAP